MWSLSIKIGRVLAGTPTIPEQIVDNRAPYFNALDAADEAEKEGRTDVSRMEELLSALLADQLTSIYRSAGGQQLSNRPPLKSHRLCTSAFASGRCSTLSNSGNFAILAAIRLASSRVSKPAALRRPGSSSKYTKASACPLWSRTMKHGWASSTVHGGGKRRELGTTA